MKMDRVRTCCLRKAKLNLNFEVVYSTEVLFLFSLALAMCTSYKDSSACFWLVEKETRTEAAAHTALQHVNVKHSSEPKSRVLHYIEVGRI